MTATPRRDQAVGDVPPSIGPVVFGTLGVGWIMVRCPSQRRRIGPVIRELERIVDPLFRQAGIRLDDQN